MLKLKLKGIMERLRKIIVFLWAYRQVGTVPIVLLLITALTLYSARYSSSFPMWTGFREFSYKLYDDKIVVPAKTLWDWMDLLIVPSILAVGLFWLNQSARKNEREIAEDNRNLKTLEAYIDRMTSLLLKDGLHASKVGDEVRDVARALTFVTLLSLDGKRKGLVIQFLNEADLINEKQAVIDLSSKIQSSKIQPFQEGDERNIWGANLKEADFSSASLRKAKLDKVDLRNASFRGASLGFVSMKEANLKNADFTGAFFLLADFTGADLTGAVMKEAKFAGKVLLEGAKLDGANLQGASEYILNYIQDVKTAKGATMPNGQKYEEWVSRKTKVVDL